MADRSEAELGQAIRAGDQKAFERAYDLYHQRVRLMAWRISHRPDWVDDLVNEAWCRAFRQRVTYDPGIPFPVWMGGILQNVYREHCRSSRVRTAGGEATGGAAGQAAVGPQSPAEIAAEAEWLEGLNDCVQRLEPKDAEIIRLRFFRDLPLRVVAKEVGIPESTLREVRLPAAYRALKKCLEQKKIRFSEVFHAQRAVSGQSKGEEQA
ncbi:MAG TPA: RNA polymerase sigma factor [Phycisphaerae bacterium]|nr:RNA polymerase sigma factor [Phycisphaerae bacterium]